MKVRVDREMCTGHGRCYVLGPDVFGADDYGHCVVLHDEVGDDLSAQARAGAENCPERAITVEQMDDVLGYSGRRCIVTGAASGIGEAATRILVDLGAEVHTLDIRKPDIIGIASFSETDLRDPDVVGRAIDAIGAVVNNLFNCAELALDATHEVSERVIPNMIDGAAISSLADADGSIARYTATRAVDLVELGIRINCIGSSGGEDRAWPLVLLGSPRSSSLTGLDLSS